MKLVNDVISHYTDIRIHNLKNRKNDKSKYYEPSHDIHATSHCSDLADVWNSNRQTLCCPTSVNLVQWIYRDTTKSETLKEPNWRRFRLFMKNSFDWIPRELKSTARLDLQFVKIKLDGDMTPLHGRRCRWIDLYVTMCACQMNLPRSARTGQLKMETHTSISI